MSPNQLQEWEDDVEAGCLPAEIFGDAQVFEREMEHVFGGSWVFVAHESEIPRPGDFVLRTLGRDEVIVSRDKAGAVRVLLNHCRHRGTRVCREASGNATQFRCPYHGWTYDCSGAWVGAPLKRRAYPLLVQKDWGLVAAPHVDSYRGLIFASLDANAPPLREHLGAMTWYLDVALGLHSGGMVVHAPPQRWRVRANWKTAAENFLADAYHVPTLHRSVQEVGLVPDVNKAVERQFHLDLENGHGAILSTRPLPEPWSTWGYPPQIAKLFELDRLSAEQRAFLENHVMTTFTVYPNLSFIRVPGLPEPDMAPVVYTCLRQWQPIAPDLIEVWSWSLSWEVAPAWFNDASHKASLSAFGPAGMFEQDDTMAWSGAPGAGRSVMARKQRMKLHCAMGEGGDYAPRAGWVGPGRVSTTPFGEGPQRSFFRRWLRDLRRGEAAAQGAR